MFFGSLLPVDCYIVTDNPKDCVASIISVKQYKRCYALVGLFDPADINVCHPLWRR
jgi:hypothetical protein